MRKKISTLIFLFSSLFSIAQSTSKEKYNSLLWEITGNGLDKPSYLFGTMHVSNKTVFHLSDSFYNAMAHCEAVSLEVNPQEWQEQLFRTQTSQTNYMSYAFRNINEYMNEKSFRFDQNYEEKLKRALSDEPMEINALLYRTVQGISDFQENTYLDLYVYQTGRRMGKKALGVEDYLTSQKLIQEATEDMAKEKRKIKFNTEGDNIFDIQKKLQDAYRKGDLDVLDSLNKKTVASDAFNEKFLYKRSEIQANSIDSIIRKESLFASVGAAHLPGERGIIAMLRKKGYTVRPITMTDEDAKQKEALDKLKVPVSASGFKSDDGLIELKMPGKFYKRNTLWDNEGWQYSDMDNGTYYMLTRVKTHAALFGNNERSVIKKVDSLLYENIPGKILSKTEITRNGYKGFAVTNKTRRGDIQRYYIIITGFEVLIFKISGTDEYANGKEADDFFSSIEIKESGQQWVNYTPSFGGFKVALPQYPNINIQRVNDDRLECLQLEANDTVTNEAYMILRKNINNYHFIEEDTLDLSLMEESLKGSGIVSSETSRKFSKQNIYPCLDMTFSLRAGGVLKAKAIIKGSAYYLLLARGNNQSNNFNKFFSSFQLTDYNYPKSHLFIDDNLKFSVQTPVSPVMDNDLKDYVQRSMNGLQSNRSGTYISTTQNRFAYFKNDSTGESVFINISTLPKYFYRKDSVKFWENEMQWKRIKEDLVIQQKEYFHKPDSVDGYRYTLIDTNTNRKIKGLVEVKGNTVYKLYSLTDNLKPESNFIKEFFESFKPYGITDRYSVFESKVPMFWWDFKSKDSLTKRIAHEGLSHILFEGKDFEELKNTISKLRPRSNNYNELKAKFINGIGRIQDTAFMDMRISYLKDIHERSGDTASFENASLQALARTLSKQSYAALKEILLQKPIVLENAAEYNELFRRMRDSLALTKTMFPDILELTNMEDYKQPLMETLQILVDSNYLKAEDYASYFTRIFFDAQIQLKKMQNKDERETERLKQTDNENETGQTMVAQPFILTNPLLNTGLTVNKLTLYADLLIPFYDKNPSVPKFFDQLLQSKDYNNLITISALMFKNNRTVKDSVLDYIASSDKYRASLYNKLSTISKANLFPAKYTDQEMMARSLMLSTKTYPKFADIQLIGKKQVSLKMAKGNVYMFKYKIPNSSDWLIGISGVQPEKQNEINGNKYLVNMTDRKFKTGESELSQCEEKLRQMILSKRKSAAQFFINQPGLILPTLMR